MKPKKHTPSKMQLSDLKEVAKYLPDTGQDHLFNMLEAYGEGMWSGVNEYIETVIIRSEIQPKTAIILINGHSLLSKVRRFLSGLKINVR